jgi:hypothetical protein
MYWLLSSKASPLCVSIRKCHLGLLLNDSLICSAFFSNEKGERRVKGLGVSFRELLLQEPIDTKDFEGALAELVGCACNELLFGFSSASRTLVPQGQIELHRLGQPGGCMHELVNRMING